MLIWFIVLTYFYVYHLFNARNTSYSCFSFLLSAIKKRHHPQISQWSWKLYRIPEYTNAMVMSLLTFSRIFPSEKGPKLKKSCYSGKEEDGLLFSFNRTDDKSMLCLHSQEMHFLTFKFGVITEGQYETKKNHEHKQYRVEQEFLKRWYI